LEDYVAAYDGEVAYADAQVGRLLDRLDRLGLYDSALIIFLADHGESLGEQGVLFRHGSTLHEVSSRVPLIVKPPGGRLPQTPRRWAGAVSLVDITPTVLDYVGAPPLGDAHGQSLREIVDSGRGDGERVVFAQRQTQSGMRYAAFSARAGIEVCSRLGRTVVSACDAGDRRVEEAASGGADSAEDQRLHDSLAGFLEESSRAGREFAVARRYRPSNREFVESFVEQHNQRWANLTPADARALESLGYLEREE
jgi:hypothetical protein